MNTTLPTPTLPRSGEFPHTHHHEAGQHGLGHVLRPGDAGYDEARAIWNGAIDRRPAFIVRCRTTAEVAASVRFAADNDLLLSVKGGGHSIPGWSVCEGGLMIDLSPMKAIQVDAQRRIALAQPGLLWGEYDAAVQAHGLASPGGEISHTGVAGLTLGGGIGWLSRRFGLACDNLVEAEVVLADGAIVTANAQQHPDLFWALRGGGGNFGIVTRFSFRLHPVAPMMAGFVMYPASQAVPVLRHFDQLARKAPQALSLVAAMVSAPPAPFVPEALHFQPMVAIAACYVGPVKEGAAAVRAIREYGSPAVDTFGVQNYADIQQWFDNSVPHGLHYHCRSEWLKPLDEGAIAAVAGAAGSSTSPMSQVLLRHMGGATAGVAPEATAFRFREAEYMLTVAAVWQPADAQPERHRDWCRATWQALRPATAGGGYVNHLTDEGEDRTREAYGAQTWDRLVSVKRRYDAGNLFRMNQNIKPN